MTDTPPTAPLKSAHRRLGKILKRVQRDAAVPPEVRAWLTPGLLDARLDLTDAMNDGEPE